MRFLRSTEVIAMALLLLTSFLCMSCGGDKNNPVTPATTSSVFEKTFGGTGSEYGLSVRSATDGGYIVAGFTSSSGAGQSDVYFLRTDVNGAVLQEKTYGGTGRDIGNAIIETSDIDYLIAGKTDSFGATGTNVYLIKLNIFGDTLWTTTVGGIDQDVANSVIETSQGDYLIAGFTNSFGAGNSDVYLIKTDLNGDTLWTKTFGGLADDRGESVIETSDGAYVITGYTESEGAGLSDAYLIKTDRDGNLDWSRTYGSAGADQGNSVLEASDDGYLVTGSSFSDSSGTNLYLIRTNADGDTLWTRSFGGTDPDFGKSASETSTGRFIITGYTKSMGKGNADVYLVLADLNGDSLWTRTLGGAADEEGYSVIEAAEGGFVITGYTESFGAGLSDLYLIKTDSHGNGTK